MSEDILKQFTESVARHEAAPEKVKPVKYSWWDGPGIIPVAKKILEIGEKDVHFRMYRGATEEGLEEIFFRVYDLSKIGKLDEALEGHNVWTFNVSHPCPPFCGGG